MLLRLFKSLGRTTHRREANASTPAVKTEESIDAERKRGDESPPQRAERLDRAHASAPLEAHLAIAYGRMAVGEENLMELVRGCVDRSKVTVPPLKALHKPLASYLLLQYFLHALEIEGESAECGVFRGTSAMLLCRAAQARDARFAGAGLHLIDSFEGLSAAGENDQFDVRGVDGSVSLGFFKRGTFAASLELVRENLRDFPEITYHRGWIPSVLASLPESRWSFVHLDVDQYEPTYSGLAYFYPRLSPGGVIICDDYGSPMFPGAHRAWDRYCDEHGARYVVFDTGQSVILKT